MGKKYPAMFMVFKTVLFKYMNPIYYFTRDFTYFQSSTKPPKSAST